MAFVTERNFYVRVLEKPPFWRASGVSSVCGDHKILPRNENFRSATHSGVTSLGGGNLRETNTSPGRILLGLSADTLFGGV